MVLSQEATPRKNMVLPQQSAVHGTVRDTSGAVIWHASIQIDQISPVSAGQKTTSGDTDSTGRFSVKAAAGHYRVCASRTGFTTACKNVEIEGGKQTTTDFSLSLDPAYASEHKPADSEVMDQRLVKLSGDNAVDCGHVPVNGNAARATACVQRAFRSNKPFHVRYDLEGIDSGLAGGLTGDGTGNIYAVTFDSLGMTTEGLQKEETMPDGSHTVVTPCPKPTKITINKYSRPTCFKKTHRPAWILD
jgi:hypothetical protein